MSVLARFRYLVIGFFLLIIATQGYAYVNPVKTIHEQAPTLSSYVLRLGMLAYQHARLDGFDRQGIVTLVDYADPSYDKRLWVIDLHDNRVLFHTYVAQGRNTGLVYAHHFSNRPGSLESSIGVYRTGHIYYGEHGYSLKIHGLDPGFNTNAFRRTIVMHPAWYATSSFVHHYGRTGRSFGCFAISPVISKRLISTVKNGTLMIAYYPDRRWIDDSSFFKPVRS